MIKNETERVEKMAIKFEEGKYYVSRDGMKCLCLFDDLSGDYPCLFVRYCANGLKFIVTTTCDGNNVKCGYSSDQDIVGPWIEKPVVNWAAMPAWAKSVAKGTDGRWRWSREELMLEREYLNGFLIPPEYAPKWEGNWKDSLVVRKEKE